MSERVIKFGIIGAGANTRLRHIPELLSQAGVEILSVANRTKASACAVAQGFGIPNATDNWKELVQDPNVDAIVIGTWPYMHCEVTVAALEAGKHVLCEARMAMNAQEAHRMLAASRRYPHLVTQIAPSPFTLPYDATIQDILRSGKLGQINVIQVKGLTGSFPDPPYSPMTWRQNRAYSGNNVMTMGIAYEALIRWVGGAESVMAMAETVVKLRIDGETEAPVTVQVPDHVDVLAKMRCGAQAHFVFSAVCGGLGGSQQEFWLFGSKGTLHLNVDDGTLKVALASEGNKLQEVDVEPNRRGYWRVEEEFINAIRRKEKVKLTDFQTAVEYMEFTDAVARSIQSRTAVTLPLLDLHC